MPMDPHDRVTALLVGCKCLIITFMYNQIYFEPISGCECFVASSDPFHKVLVTDIRQDSMALPDELPPCIALEYRALDDHLGRLLTISGWSTGTGVVAGPEILKLLSFNSRQHRSLFSGQHLDVLNGFIGCDIDGRSIDCRIDLRVHQDIDDAVADLQVSMYHNRTAIAPRAWGRLSSEKFFGFKVLLEHAENLINERLVIEKRGTAKNHQFERNFKTSLAKRSCF